MSKKLIVVIIVVFIVVIGLILKSINNDILIFNRNILLVVFNVVALIVILKPFFNIIFDERITNVKHNTFSFIITLIVLTLTISFSFFSITDSIIIKLGKEIKSSKCVKIVGKDISNNHGNNYYFYLKKISNIEEVKTLVDYDEYQRYNSQDLIYVNFYKNTFVSYFKKSDKFIECSSN